MKNLFLTLTLTFLVSPTWAGHSTGNGGDHTRATFIKMGNAVINFLNDDRAGQALLKKHSLSLLELQSTLDIRFIKVVELSLIDNGNVPVDGLGEAGKITLNKDNWMAHFEKDRDVYYLVFHEMLRAIGVNDDNYIISSAINPFPASRKIITHISSQYPLIDEENLENKIDIAAMIVSGSGCSKDKAGTNVEFDSTRNQIEITLNQSQANVKIGTPSDRKACMLALPIKLQKNQRLVVTQIDQSAKLELGKNIKTKIYNEVFMAGSKAPIASKEVVTLDQGLTGRTLLRRNEVLKSNCGAQDLLRMNSSAQISSTDTSSNGAIAVDRITISLKLEACK